MTIRPTYTRLLCLLLAAAATCSCATRQRAYSTNDKKAPQRPYSVNGQRYEPLASHAGFVEEGIASSYGLDFHGRQTSSGELFDMNAMTAAHKTLPLGVFVKVRHKRTGKEVVVRINDRGPFVRERIIDLSEGAARQLDMVHDGLAPVVVTALGYRTTPSGAIPQFRNPDSYDTGRFSLQVASFKNKSNAYRYADDLKARYGTADVQEAFVGGTLYYRVRLGVYSSLKEARTGQDVMERKGFPGNFIVAID